MNGEIEVASGYALCCFGELTNPGHEKRQTSRTVSATASANTPSVRLPAHARNALDDVRNLALRLVYRGPGARRFETTVAIPLRLLLSADRVPRRTRTQ